MAMAKEEPEVPAAASAAPGIPALAGADAAATAVKKDEDESSAVVPSSLSQWIDAAGAVQPENFKEILLHVTDALLVRHGGPFQYFNKNIGRAAWPIVEGVRGPPGASIPTTARPAVPGRHIVASRQRKASQPVHLAIGLVKGLFFQASYVQNRPTQAVLEGDCGEPLFFTHYVKGAARATSILFLAHVLLEVLRLDVASMHPALHQSLIFIKARRSIAATDAATIALENAKLSARGDIRRAHDVSTWLSKLSKLKQMGLNAAEIIKRWNDTATRDSALQGSKRTAISQLLDLPQQSIDLLLEHTSQLGDATAFTNETFANKRLSPGYTPRGLDKAWQRRLTVSHDGWRLFVKFVHSSQLRKTVGMRGKWDKALLEETLNMCQCLWSCMEEIASSHPIGMQDMEASIVQAFLDGHMTWELEAQSAVTDAASTFAPAQLSFFKDMIATSLSKRDEKLTAIGQGPTISPGQLEEQAFNLAMSALEHDVNSFKAWETKCQDREAARYFQKLQHDTKRHKQAKDLAASVFKVGTMWQMDVVAITHRDTTNLQIVQSMLGQIQKLNQLSAEHVHCIALTNWSSPAIYSGAAQKSHANLMGALVNGEGTHLAACLSPSHFYKKGSLHKAEQACMQLLGNANLNTDSRFALAYAGKTDDRDRRSLLVRGILLFPGDSSDSAKDRAVYQMFRNIKLLQEAVVTGVQMLPSSDMVTIEDMHEDALPASTDITSHVSLAEKHQQIGVDAARKLVQAILPEEFPHRAAILVVDATPHSMEMAKAVYMHHAAKVMTTPVYYLAFSDSEEEKEWQLHHMTAWLSEGFLSGSLALPPGAPSMMPKELPADVVTTLPPKPELNTLSWSEKKKQGLQTLKTPDKLLQSWHDHAVYGPRFREWLSQTRDAIALDIKDADADASAAASSAATTNRKRAPAPAGASGNPVEESPLKVAKAEPLPEIAKEDLPTPLCWQAQLPSQFQKGKGATLKLLIVIGQKIFICNEGSSDVTIPAGTVIAGYYKGTFQMQGGGKKATADLELRATDCEYRFTDSEAKVLHEGKITTLGHIVAEKRALTPLSVNLCYQELVEQPKPGNSTYFIVKPKMLFLFRPENAPTADDKKAADGSFTLPHSSMAGRLETSCWQTSCTQLLWSVKWSAKGLQPVRPVIAASRPIQVSAGKAVELK
eukprot:Skav225341  [mRNA]  locus=scaffold3721:8917:12502:- [translate_table: standard]